MRPPLAESPVSAGMPCGVARVRPCARALCVRLTSCKRRAIYGAALALAAAFFVGYGRKDGGGRRADWGLRLLLSEATLDSQDSVGFHCIRV
eukprot:6184658-Pleurochrysis_carterae.AAC.1